MSPALRQYSASQVQIISQPRANQGEGTRMPEDSLRQVGAGVRSTDPPKDTRQVVRARDTQKAPGTTMQLRAAPLPDGHSHG